MVACLAHNQEVGSSILPPATNINNMGENKIKTHMTVMVDTTIRGIVRAVNEEEIKKEDIVSLLKENGQYVLIYFK